MFPAGEIANAAEVATGITYIAAKTRGGYLRVKYGPRRPFLSVRRRARLRLRPGPGWAGRWDCWRAHGRPASRKIARHARPSLGRAALFPGRRGMWREYATYLGRAQGWVWPQGIYANLEHNIVMFAAPQDGKTQMAGGMILDAPGPVVATSIRGDLVQQTVELRSARGRVDLWDPENVSGLESTVSWNPVNGCEDIAVAVRRAGTMVETIQRKGLDSESGFWDDQASLTFGALLHAAALSGADLRDVHTWAGGEDDTPALVLEGHPGASDAAKDHLHQFLIMPDKMRMSVAATLARVMKFMHLPACVSSIVPGEGKDDFDFGEFIHSRGTLYLVAGDSATSPAPPLFAAMVAELAYTVLHTGRRLDPPLAVVLDEAGNIAPVPVPAWASWSAGSGIQLRIIAQAWAQLKERWGDNGASQIWQCSKAKVVFGGTSESELAELTSEACGTVPVRVRRRGAWDTQEVPLLPVPELRMLPLGRAVVIQGRGEPVIVRVGQLHRRRDYKRLRLRGITALAPAVPRRVPRPVPSLLYAVREVPAQHDELAARRTLVVKTSIAGEDRR